MDTQEFTLALQTFGFFSLIVSAAVSLIKAKYGSDGIGTLLILAVASIIFGAVCSYAVGTGWGESIIALAGFSQVWYGFFTGDLQQSSSFVNYVR